MPAIEVSNLQRAFSDEVLAVAGIDLYVDEGEIYAFLGPNGAGKTTTVRMLTTLLRPTGGSATVAGHDVVADPAAVRTAIGVALQEAAQRGTFEKTCERLSVEGFHHSKCPGMTRPFSTRVGT